MQASIQPTLEDARKLLSNFADSPDGPNLVPMCATIPGDLLTPSLAYLKVSAK